MSRTARWIFVVTVVVVTAIFTRLGIWQLHRLAERKAENARQVARRDLPPLRIPGEMGPLELPLVGAAGTTGGAVGAASDSARRDTLVWRKALLAGRYDYGREIVIRDRSWTGAPGVYLLTPLLVRSGGDSAAVLVLRGWLPSGDAFHARLAVGRPDTGARSRAVPTLLLPGHPAEELRIDTIQGPDGPHPVVAHVDPGRLAGLLPYPIADLYAQVTDSAPPGGYPVRIPLPELGNGPHLSYAIQWFALALISVVGGVIFLRASERR
ncbi:MAG TPA: SURF1 family protein [Gemmatimonadota bacterium]|nr:SURF1 family protein [Gemmatimonadota bacterium]